MKDAAADAPVVFLNIKHHRNKHNPDLRCWRLQFQGAFDFKYTDL